MLESYFPSEFIGTREVNNKSKLWDGTSLICKHLCCKATANRTATMCWQVYGPVPEDFKRTSKYSQEQ